MILKQELLRFKEADGRYSERRMSRGYSGHTKEQMMQKIAELQREVEMMN